MWWSARWRRRCGVVLTVAAVCLTGTVRALEGPAAADGPYRDVYGRPAEVDTVEAVKGGALEPATGRRLLLVSTLDGQLTALDPANGGALLWSVTAQEGGMLSSTLTQNLQLSQQGQVVRLIPALDGRLFSYDGDHVEALPVTADTLLQASYRFADDTVIMGGSEVGTLGIDVNTGQLHYRCGAAGCVRLATSDGDDDGRDMLVLRQHTQTVRAVEPRSGQERWNFSVSRHELALSAGEPTAAGAPPPSDSLITADLARGTLAGTERGRRWRHQFNGPLVHVWRLDGGRLQEVDLLAPAAEDSTALRPLLYLGIHEKQLYIQQSRHGPSGSTQLAVTEAARGPPQVKWRPYVMTAGSRTPLIHGTTSRDNPLLLADHSDKALALRPEEYPYEGGYYLYSRDCVLEQEQQPPPPDRHGPFPHPHLPLGDEYLADSDNVVYVVITSLWYWWPQIVLLSASIAVLLNLLVTEHYRLYYQARAVRAVRTLLRLRPPLQYVVREVPVPQEVIREVEVVREVMRDPPPVERPPLPPRSRFLEDFEPVQCLGKGGFGVVFEARNRLDSHSYAVKRIRLPGRERARRRVLREVSCLAKLEHRNIVRYFYCWTEQLSAGCLQEQDRVLDSSEWVSDRTPLNSVESGATSAAGSPEELSGSVLRVTRFSSALPGDGDPDCRLRTIGGGFLPALTDSPHGVHRRTGADSSARSAEDSIVFSNETRPRGGGGGGSSLDSSGTFSVQDSGELAAQQSRSGPSAGGGARRRLADTLTEDSLLSEPSGVSTFCEDSVVFAADSGQPIVDYTIPDGSEDSSSDISGPLVAFQTNRPPRDGGSDFWDDDEGDEDEVDGAAVYLFIQMQLCRKESLKDWLNANSGPRSSPRVFAIFRQILSGVEYVHSQRLMHRDLKPSNIFFALDGTVKIGDFGLATTLGSDPASHTPAPAGAAAGQHHTDQVGTQLYMSPEQVLGHAYDYRVDIYSLGIILFELLVPFATQMERHQTLSQVRRLVFPDPFQRAQPAEHALLAQMLCHQPARRPSIAEIRVSVARCRAASVGGSLVQDELDAAVPPSPQASDAESDQSDQCAGAPPVDSPRPSSVGSDASAASSPPLEWPDLSGTRFSDTITSDSSVPVARPAGAATRLEAGRPGGLGAVGAGPESPT